MTTAYFDTCIQSGRRLADLKPAEMNAIRALEKAEREGKIKIVTSRETHREQERTNDPTLRAQLVQSHGDTPVVPKDHTLLGIHNQMNHLGTICNAPMLTEIVDGPLFDSLIAAGLKKADARHLMYAAHADNACDWFVTTDPDFIERRAQLEELCPGLRIVRPSELAIELSLNTNEDCDDGVSGSARNKTPMFTTYYDHRFHEVLPMPITSSNLPESDAF
jgi:hypothetical protein